MVEVEEKKNGTITTDRFECGSPTVQDAVFTSGWNTGAYGCTGDSNRDKKVQDFSFESPVVRKASSPFGVRHDDDGVCVLARGAAYDSTDKVPFTGQVRAIAEDHDGNTPTFSETCEMIYGLCWEPGAIDDVAEGFNACPVEDFICTWTLHGEVEGLDMFGQTAPPTGTWSAAAWVSTE